MTSRPVLHAASRRLLGLQRRTPASNPRAEAPEVRELLERLDDAVFDALGGCQAALAKTRMLWPEIVATLGAELVDESREQYLRYAVELTRRFEFKEIRNPSIAMAALE